MRSHVAVVGGCERVRGERLTMPTIPLCAKRCEYVAMLLSELAVARGTSENVQRVTHGLDGEDHAPERCTDCDYPYESALAARECADFDLAD